LAALPSGRSSRACAICHARQIATSRANHSLCISRREDPDVFRNLITIRHQYNTNFHWFHRRCSSPGRRLISFAFCRNVHPLFRLD
jgi:hypothetical protein